MDEEWALELDCDKSSRQKEENLFKTRRNASLVVVLKCQNPAWKTVSIERRLTHHILTAMFLFISIKVDKKYLQHIGMHFMQI